MPVANTSPTHSEQRAAAASRLADSVLRRAGIAATPATRKPVDGGFQGQPASPAASSIRGATAHLTGSRTRSQQRRSAAGLTPTPTGAGGPATGSRLHYYCYSPSAGGSSAYREHDATDDSSFGGHHEVPPHRPEREQPSSTARDVARHLHRPETGHSDPTLGGVDCVRRPEQQAIEPQPSLLAALARPIAVVRGRLERVQRVEAALRADAEREWLEDRLCIFDAMTVSRVAAMSMATLHSSPTASASHSRDISPATTPPQRPAVAGIGQVVSHDAADGPSPTALQPLLYNGHRPHADAAGGRGGAAQSKPKPTAGVGPEPLQRRQPSPPQVEPPATASVAAASLAHRYCCSADPPAGAGRNGASTAAVLTWRQGVRDRPAARRLDYEQPSQSTADRNHAALQRGTVAGADSTFTSIAGTETTPERSRVARRPIMAPVPSPAPSKTPKRSQPTSASRQHERTADATVAEDANDVSHLIVEDVANLTMESGMVDSDDDGGGADGDSGPSLAAAPSVVTTREYYFCDPIDCDVSADLVLFPRKFSAARPRSGVSIGHQFVNGDRLMQADGRPLRTLTDVAEWSDSLPLRAGKEEREHWVVVVRGDRRVCVDL